MLVLVFSVSPTFCVPPSSLVHGDVSLLVICLYGYFLFYFEG